MWRTLLIFGILLLLTDGILHFTRRDPVTDSMSLALYDTDANGNQILSRVDFNGLQVILMETSANRPMISFEWSRDGKWILVTVKNQEDLSGDVYIMHRSGRTVRHIYHTAGIRHGAQYSPDSACFVVIVEDTGENYVVQVDTEGNVLSSSLIGSRTDGDSNWIVTWLDNQNIQVATSPTTGYHIDLATDTATYLEDELIKAVGYAVSFDGQWQAQTNYSRQPYAVLVKQSLTDPEITIPLWEVETRGLSYIFWSNDNRWIAINAAKPSDLAINYPDAGGLYLIDTLNYDATRQLLDASFYKKPLPFVINSHNDSMNQSSQPFSPHNEWLALVRFDARGMREIYTNRNRDIEASLFVVRTDGSGEIIDQLVTGKILDSYVAWSPFAPLTWHREYFGGLAGFCLIVSTLSRKFTSARH